MGLVRRHFRWLRDAKTAVSLLENVIATLLGVLGRSRDGCADLDEVFGAAGFARDRAARFVFILSVSVATGLRPW